MAAKKEARVVPGNPEIKGEEVVPYALLFVLEDLAVNGRKALLETLRSAARATKERFDERFFFRHGLSGSPASLPALLDGLETGRGTWEDIQQRVLDRLASDKSRLPALLGQLLKTASQRRIATLALTSLPEETALALAGRAGLEETGTPVFVVKDAGPDFPSCETWAKAVRSLQRRPRACGALVANGAASRGAVMAGLKVVAVPDEFTSFEDFGGAVMVLDSLDAASPAEVLRALFSDK